MLKKYKRAVDGVFNVGMKELIFAGPLQVFVSVDNLDKRHF